MDDLIINSLLNTVSAVVIGSTIIICAAWVITSIVSSTRQRANTRTRAEVYNRLIDKFGTAAELIEFFESDAGFRFIEEHTLEVSQPVAKIMGSIRLGVTLGLIGIGARLSSGMSGLSKSGRSHTSPSPWGARFP